MKLIDGDRIITAQLYDDEHEEYTEKKMSIIDYINAYTDEGVTEADVVDCTKWIPVSERLPELNINNIVSEDVLVFDGSDIRVGEYRKAKHLDGGHWRVYGYFDEFFDVIAWMPLPEPYKAESEDIEECQCRTTDCMTTVEEYRAKLIDTFHKANHDELIALVTLPTEKDFEHLEWLLKNHLSREAARQHFDLVQQDDLKMSYDDIDTHLSKLPSVIPTTSEDEKYRNIMLKIPRDHVSDLLFMLNSAISFAIEHDFELTDEDSIRLKSVVTRINDQIILQSTDTARIAPWEV